MAQRRRTFLNSNGQASVEYLLTVAAVLLALSGVVGLFSTQVNNYLTMLFKILVLPF